MTEDGPDLVHLEITDTIDLHSFAPDQTAEVVGDYLQAAIDKGIDRVRIVHGRGIGAQRRTVRHVLERHPRVVEYFDAAAAAGGWGATIACLRLEPEDGTSNTSEGNGDAVA